MDDSTSTAGNPDMPGLECHHKLFQWIFSVTPQLTDPVCP
jgi:hypothetical protein